MHAETLPPGSRQTLDWLARQNAPALQGWMLAGGTGLAFQIGHRISEDFDFFRTDPMDTRTLHDVFKTYGANRVNRYHLIKSLTYFDDAEREPMPQMLRPVDWEACKRFFIQAARDAIM